MNNTTSGEARARAAAKNVKGWVALIGLAIALFAMLIVGGSAATPAFATPGNGVSQTPVASGVLSETVGMKLKNDGGFGDGLDVSSVSIVKNIIQPGGYFGWHQHGGPSWIIVTQGTLTFYDGDDPTCTGHPVSAGNAAGSAFLDTGDHTHNARNETNAVVENYVVRMLPPGGVARIDMPNPGVCPTLP